MNRLSKSDDTDQTRAVAEVRYSNLYVALLLLGEVTVRQKDTTEKTVEYSSNRGNICRRKWCYQYLKLRDSCRPPLRLKRNATIS